MSIINETVKRMFPGDFKEFFPVKKHWWEKIDFENLKSRQGLVLSICAAIILIPGIYYYNKFIELTRFTEMEQAQIQVQEQRRKDLSINLSHMVIDYARHEREMFKYAIDKKAGGSSNVDLLESVLSKSGVGDFAAMKDGLSSNAIGKVMALAEAYPELKLNTNFQIMMQGLINSEDKISERRLAYNEAASHYHAFVRSIPACFYAFVLGYRESMFHYVTTDSDLNKSFRVAY